MRHDSKLTIATLALAGMFCGPADAAVIFNNSATSGEVAATTDGDQNGTISNFSVGGTSDRLLLVSVLGEGLDSFKGVTFGGIALTQALSRINGTDRFSDAAAIYYLLNPSTTPGNIVATVNFDRAGAGGIVLHAASFSNVEQAGPFQTVDGSNPNDVATASLNINANQGGLIFDAIETNFDSSGSTNTAEGPQALTATGGQTVLFNDNTPKQGGYTVASAYEIASATGTQTQGWALSNEEEHAYVAVSFNAIPEPASLALIALGGLMLLPRRSR